MDIGLALPHYDYSFPDGTDATMERVLEYALRAETLGFDSAWVSDHLFLDLAKYGGPARRYRTPECLTMMAAVAARTTRIRIGSLVLCASFRHPRILSEQLRSVDDASHGRLEVGLGAGWYEPEFLAAGIPFGTVPQRIERMRTIAGHLDAQLHPRPPIWIGGKGGPKVMSVVAEHADGWNVVWRITPEQFRERLDTLAEACAAVKRDPATVRLSVGLYTLMGTDDRDLAQRFKALQAWTPGGALDSTSLDAYREGGLVGTPDECAAIVKDFEAFGVDTLIVAPASLPFAVFDDEQLELIARELIPRVR
ncbi:MAG TPA: LLM class flavin-dependent oxidoreductase [Actinomycetota bacterium]|nr:LLM class flavin-dependent oxidoreductase [Actinomycetota bacterium]